MKGSVSELGLSLWKNLVLFTEFLTVFFCSWTTELHAGRRVEEDSKKAKQRAQTVVVGDMEPLLSALPTINIPELVRSTKSTDNR